MPRYSINSHIDELSIILILNIYYKVTIQYQSWYVFHVMYNVQCVYLHRHTHTFIYTHKYINKQTNLPMVQTKHSSAIT